MTAEPEPRRFRLTFGLERLGLIALAMPRVSLVLILLVSVAAAFGLMKLRVDDSLSELFRTNTKEFRQFEEIDRRFPSSEYDVLAVVEGEGLLTRQGLTKLASALTELNLTDGVSGLVSMLSARDRPDASGYAPPIVPDELPEGAAFAAMIKKLKANEIVRGKFLSEDGRLALIVMSLDREIAREYGTDAVIAEIEKALKRELKGSGLTVRLTGAPVMQREIRNAVSRDRIIYNGLGLILGLGVALFFFRKLSLTLLAVAGPTVGILWTLGAVGGLDYRLNLFINVLTPLILVSGFSDSMHLVMAIRRDIRRGDSRLEAARNAVREVAPACLLTAMNAAIALASFALAESALIRTFGAAALLAVAISYIAVAVVVPTLAYFALRWEKPDGSEGKGAFSDDDTEIGAIRLITTGVVDLVSARPAIWFMLGLAAVISTGMAYATLKPQYRLADQVPDREQALAATERLDKKLTGANPVHVMIAWKGGQKLFDDSTLKVIKAAHEVLEKQAGLGNVWSMESLRRWLEAAGKADNATVKSYVKVLPQHLVRRFVAKDETAVLVTGRLPDIDASEILPVVEIIDKALEPVRAAHPGYEISVTGLSAIAARNSAKLIGELNWGLVGDMFVIFIFLAIALRSMLAGVSSILPSLFPIFATGTLLWFAGKGLQFASIIAITVAFALAIDSTIHFINRFLIEEARPELRRAGVRAVLRATMQHIGPAVVLTTIVLALGLGVTVLSDLPSLRQFGFLTAACLGASLIGQLVILPSAIAMFRRFWPVSVEASTGEPAASHG